MSLEAVLIPLSFVLSGVILLVGVAKFYYRLGFLDGRQDRIREERMKAH